MDVIDILSIDTQVKKNNKKGLELYKEKEKEKEYIVSLLKNKYNENIVKDLEKKKIILETEMINIQTATELNFNFYMIETCDVLEKYKNILQKPMKISFYGKTSTNVEKEAVVNEYLTILKKYYNIEDFFDTSKEVCLQGNTKKENQPSFCTSCNMTMIMDEEKFVCSQCGIQVDILGNSTSYKDINRVNITYKFSYERIVHFRDCINQYQGKQNSLIDDSIYKALENQFQLHNLLIGDESTPREVRFQNITKDHVTMFLKETNNSKYYEHVFLIYHHITGKKNDDISHLEKVLLADFETLSNLYDKKFIKERKIDRKSFINAQYVLYQLLRKHKYPCKQEDFNIIKTLDRKSFHDDILAELFQELSWNYNPSF